MKTLSALLLSLACLTAQAQTVSNVVAQTCNIALTDCVLETDDGKTITINPMTALRYPVSPVLMDIQDEASGVDTSYSGGITAGVVLTDTLYRRDTEYTFTFTPAATVVAVYRLRRGGSGRGGWAWHASFSFETLTVY